MRAGLLTQATRTQRIIEGSLLAGLLRPLLRSPRERAQIDLCPASAAGLLESGPGPARTVTAGHLREYWRRRATLAAMMLARTTDLDVARRLEQIRDEALRRCQG